ncbi:hypothetical protein [Streptomyces sp. NPDC006134]|uniref:hypothetical protein n=1 Tax=Streptomyces sp. NPDC006134 TaxID=3154467 RepID=UPI0033F51E37
MPLPASRSFSVQYGSESVLVSNVDPELPSPPTEADLAKVVEAGRDNPVVLLPEAALQAIARATTSPEAVAVQLRPTAAEPTGLLMVENVDGATLRSAVTRVFLSELLPGIQPRTGMEVMEVPDPQVQGVTDADRPCASIRYRYRDPTHLQDHVWQTLHATLSLNSYGPSVLARKVTRNLITHPVEITFEDGTESFHALVVRDGITRLASAWEVQTGPGAEPADVATLAVNAFFGKTIAAPGPASETLERRLAARREKWRRTLREEFAREIAEPEPGLRAAQIAQTYVVPAQVAVGVEGHPGHLLAAEDVFDDAIRSVLASVHVEFKQWDTAAQNVEVATRALKRVIQLGDSLVPKDDLQTIYGLAVGRIQPEDLPQHFDGDPSPPGTALWRAVYLVHALTRPELLEPLKDQAKAIKGGRRMGLKGFAELLGPLIDLPWRAHKKHVTKQARNAWNNGGVLTSDVIQEWEPRPTDDFTTLVGPAMAGDIDARCTLAVAGGVALIADKLLTRNVGSALMAAKEKGGVPFRADVNQVIEDLSQKHNETGLWTLALAAERFRDDALPENAVTMRQLVRQKTGGTGGTGAHYAHYKVDLSRDDKIERDDDEAPVLLHQWDIVWASNPDRARKAHSARPPALLLPRPASGTAARSTGTETDAEDAAGEPSGAQAGGSSGTPAPGNRPASQRAADHRNTLRASVTAARDAMDQLLLLEPVVGSHTPVVPPDTLDALLDQIVSLQADVENLRRKTARDDSPTATAEQDPDEEAAEADL